MNSKTILVALLVIVGLLSVVTQYLNPEQLTIENFLGMSGVAGVPVSNPFVMENEKPTALPVMMSGPPAFYTVPGTYQSQLSARMGSPQGLTSNVRSNLNQSQLAYTLNDPLSKSASNLANIVEKFDYSAKTPAGDYIQQDSKLVKQPGGDIVQLPSLNMATASTDGQGVEGQPIVYDRLIVGLRNNRLYSQGDFIRGDLPIVPAATGWFRPAATPNESLNPGALAVMGGAYNETNRMNSGLQMLSSAGAQTTLSGVNYQAPGYTPVGQENARLNSVAMQMGRDSSVGSQVSGAGVQVSLRP